MNFNKKLCQGWVDHAMKKRKKEELFFCYKCICFLDFEEIYKNIFKKYYFLNNKEQQTTIIL